MDEDWDDVELIVRSWDEPEAFGIVFERHAETLLGYFARRTLDPEAAAELLAEAVPRSRARRHRMAVRHRPPSARPLLPDRRGRRPRASAAGHARARGLVRGLRTDRGD